VFVKVVTRCNSHMHVDVLLGQDNWSAEQHNERLGRILGRCKLGLNLHGVMVGQIYLTLPTSVLLKWSLTFSVSNYTSCVLLIPPMRATCVFTLLHLSPYKLLDF
jgi:hypothetical protein